MSPESGQRSGAAVTLRVPFGVALLLLVGTIGTFALEWLLYTGSVEVALAGYLLAYVGYTLAALRLRRCIPVLQAFALLAVFRLVNLAVPAYVDLTVYWIPLVYLPLIPAAALAPRTRAGGEASDSAADDATNHAAGEGSTLGGSSDASENDVASETATERPSSEVAMDDGASGAVVDETSSDAASEDEADEAATDDASSDAAPDEEADEAGTDDDSTDAASEDEAGEAATDDASSDAPTEHAAGDETTEDGPNEVATASLPTDARTGSTPTDAASEETQEDSDVDPLAWAARTSDEPLAESVQQSIRKWFAARDWRRLALAVPAVVVIGAGLAIVEYDVATPPELVLQLTVEAALLLAAVVVLAAVVEELLFRGLLQSALTEWLGAPAAIGLASLLFAAMQSTATTAPVAMAALAGLFYGAAYEYTGTIVTPVLAHAVVNLLAFVVLPLYGTPLQLS